MTQGCNHTNSAGGGESMLFILFLFCWKYWYFFFLWLPNWAMALSLYRETVPSVFQLEPFRSFTQRCFFSCRRKEAAAIIHLAVVPGTGNNLVRGYSLPFFFSLGPQSTCRCEGRFQAVAHLLFAVLGLHTAPGSSLKNACKSIKGMTGCFC